MFTTFVLQTGSDAYEVSEGEDDEKTIEEEEEQDQVGNFM